MILPRPRSARPTPALVVACLALAAALGSNAWAVGGSASENQPRTIKVETSPPFTIMPGNVEAQTVQCPQGYWPVTGGYHMLSGNFVYPLTAIRSGPNGFGFVALVPNKIAELGVLRARFQIQVVCAEKGKPIVP